MNIAIVFGGRSVEHDISIITAKQIYNMAGDKHQFFLIYADKNDQLFLYTNKEFLLSDFKDQNDSLVPIVLRDGKMLFKGKGIFGHISAINLDAAVFCCHGGNGENGVLQSYFISGGVPVSAGTSVGLGICMDKWLTKQFLKANGINHIQGFCIKEGVTTEEVDKQIQKSFGYPVILKPKTGGSSIGIEVVKNFSQLQQAMQVAFEFDNFCLVEEALTDFIEYNCAVLGSGDDVTVSKIDQPERKEDILSFSDKYLSSSKGGKKGSMKTQQRKFPATLPAKLEAKIQGISKKVFNLLGLHGVVRIDFMLQGKNLYLNEINAIPGSLAYYFFVNTNFSVQDFVEKLAQIAIEEYQKLHKLSKNFITNLIK